MLLSSSIVAGTALVRTVYWVSPIFAAGRRRKRDAVDRRQPLAESVVPVIVELLLVEGVRAEADLQHRDAGGVVLHHERRLDPGRQQHANIIGGRDDLL